MTTSRDPASDILPARDALGATAPLAFERAFPLLGIPVRISSNASRAIELAAASFCVWDALEAAQQDRDVAVDMRVVVHDGATAGEGAGDGAATWSEAPFVYRRHGDVLVGACGTTVLTIDLVQRRYLAFVPSQALDRAEWYRWHINGMARFAVSALDRHPVHAATWLVGETAVVVVGPAGSGKSTLAFAALRRGFPLLSEEATHVSLARGLRLWGHAERITLGADAVTFFPELSDRPPRLLPSGKVKRAFSIVQAAPPLTHAGPVLLCTIASGRTGPPVIEPLSATERHTLLAGAADEGFDQFPDVHRRVATALAGAPAYRLSVGADPDAAVAALAQVADRHQR
jgi:hypothetical protein